MSLKSMRTLVTLLIVLLSFRHLQISNRANMKFNYPSARRDESVSDDYHGTKVKDPYRWLEDPDSEETKAFVEAQNAVSNPFIEQCEYRQKIQESLTEKWNFAKYSSPAEHGGYYYYYHNSGLQNQSVMYVQDSLDGEPRVFLDPNKLSEDGTLAISGTAFSEDGSFFAYGLSQSGSDWITIKFKECPSGKDLPDTLEHVKFSSMAWTHDNKGMFYNRYPVDGKSDGTETTSNFYHRLYYHVLGTKQSEDVLAVEFSNEPKWKMEKPVANGNSTSTPSLTLSPSNNKANQMYETSYIVSSVAVAAAAGGSNFNPLYGASAPPAYSNYHTPNFYGLSYSPSKFRKPLNNEDSSSLPKETMLKPKQKEKAMKKQKKKNNQSKTTAPKNCSTPQPSCTNKQNLTNENFNQYGYNYSTPHYNQLPNQMYDSGSYGQLNPSYCQQYAGYMNGPTNSVYYPSYGTSLNQYYPAGSSYAASALTNLPEHTANSVCSVPYPSHPTTSVAESVTYTSRPTSPIVGSASYPYHPTTSVAESTLYPSPTSPVAESVSYPTCPTSPIVGSSSCPYRPTSPVVGSASCPYRPTSPVVGLASYPYHSTTSVAGPTPYPYCQTSPVAESASYPSYPNSFTSYPYSPYWYQQNACSPYSYNSYYQQPQFAYKQNHPDVCPLKKSCGQEMTNEKSKMASHFKTGKFGSTPDTIFVANFRGAEVSDCGKYLLLSPNEGCDPVNRLFYVALDKLPNGITGKLPYTILVDNFDAQYEYITNEGSVFTFLTNLNAPKYKVINIDFTKPEQENWQTLIEEDENAVLEWVSCVNKNKLVLCYLKDVKNKIYIHSLETGKLLNEIPLDIGTVIGCSGKKKNKEIFIHFMSFLTPGVIYRVDLSVDDPKPEVYRLIKVSNFDFSQFEIKQIFYPSKDGTKIPMFLVHKKGLVLDGKNPTYLYGYGGFEISIKPTFSVSRLVFLKDLGGLFAVANIRGGGEYGETWHRSGTHSKKQNVFDDFQAAADYLISQKYTTSEKLVIHGHSNGGLLIAACINQRPELYGCAIAQVGVLDMLRFHRFTIGHAWTTDFGCSEVPEHFKFLKEYSPVHNIRVPKGDIQYPSTLLLTADHDDRVVPLHSLKYIAELQHTMKDQEKQTKPLMIKVDTKAGHGSGKPTAKMIQEHTDLYCFIMKTLHLTWHES